MKYHYIPKSDLEKFGVKVHGMLVENFPRTFFVGGMVRDLLLNKEVIDVDIATEALPEQVAKLLQDNQIIFDDKNKKFGVVIAIQGQHRIEITTFREDIASDSRYPKVKFVKSPKIDSKRRDFTINSLYLSVIDDKILDYHKGILDIKKRLIRFIGEPARRIKEDPLRIIRALRFSLLLDLKLEKKTALAIKNNFDLINTLTEARTITEINKLNDKKKKNMLRNLISDQTELDNYLK